MENIPESGGGYRDHESDQPSASAYEFIAIDQDPLLVDKIADPGHDLERQVEMPLDIRQVLINLDLTPRQNQVILMRYGLEDGNEMTQLEVARELGLSPQAVANIELAVLGKLRQSKRRGNLANYPDESVE